MHKIFNLCFVIGAFFVLAGILLLTAYFMKPVTIANSINLYCGGLYILFGGGMALIAGKA